MIKVFTRYALKSSMSARYTSRTFYALTRRHNKDIKAINSHTIGNLATLFDEFRRELAPMSEIWQWRSEEFSRERIGHKTLSRQLPYSECALKRGIGMFFCTWRIGYYFCIMDFISLHQNTRRISSRITDEKYRTSLGGKSGTTTKLGFPRIRPWPDDSPTDNSPKMVPQRLG